jgi:HSP20 family protein
VCLFYFCLDLESNKGGKVSVFDIIKSHDMIDNMRNMLDSSYGYSNLPTMTYTTAVSTGTWLSNARINKNDEGYEISIDLPGLSRSDVEISVHGKTLTISARREMKTSNSKFAEDYKNSWTLPDHTQFDTVSARYDAGILTINVPLKKEYSRKIEIE